MKITDFVERFINDVNTDVGISRRGGFQCRYFVALGITIESATRLVHWVHLCHETERRWRVIVAYIYLRDIFRVVVEYWSVRIVEWWIWMVLCGRVVWPRSVGCLKISLIFASRAVKYTCQSIPHKRSFEKWKALFNGLATLYEENCCEDIYLVG